MSSLNGKLSFNNTEESADVFTSKVDLEYDSLDDAFFPMKGSHAVAWLKKSKQKNCSVGFSEDIDYKQYFFEYTGAISKGKHTLIANARIGETHDINGNFNDVEDFSSFYTLGGLFSLSGLPTNAVTGNNIAFTSLIYRYRLSEKDFFGSFSVPLYIGMSGETGATWYGNGAFSRDKLLHSGSVYMAADTILGPFYLGFGTTEFDYYSIYISLGKSF